MKEIDMKNRTYYFFNDRINFENFDSSLLKIDKKIIQKHWYLYTGYITIKNIGDYGSIHIVNPLYFIISKVDGYIEKKNGNKYFIFASTGRN